MTTLHVIILAQGQQSRLPDLALPKQLLEIPFTGETILKRTFRLLDELAPGAFVTLVAHRGVAEAIGAIHRTDSRIACGAARSFWTGSPSGVMSASLCVTLDNPGNHAVAGLQQVVHAATAHNEDIAVLLGDVIYSRAALKAILAGVAPNARPAFDGVTFVGTPDLTGGGGELFGIRVSGRQRWVLLSQLPKSSDAFTAYQPGRLRELLWEAQKRERLSWEPRVHQKAPYLSIADFTTDIDTPADLARLPEIGRVVAQEGP